MASLETHAVAKKKKTEPKRRSGADSKQVLFLLADSDREFLQLISDHHGLPSLSMALRLALNNQQHECAARDCGSIDDHTPKKKTGSVGRPGFDVALSPFAFWSVPRDREAMEAIQKAHDVVRSVAVRHAIAEEAKRCQLVKRRR